MELLTQLMTSIDAPWYVVVTMIAGFGAYNFYIKVSKDKVVSMSDLNNNLNETLHRSQTRVQQLEAQNTQLMMENTKLAVENATLKAQLNK